MDIKETPKKVAIVQSCYIPWKGYFDLINMIDEFILYDDTQYTRRDWRNRNLIKTPQGLLWLSIPVEVKGKYLQKINETKINDATWAASHWKTIVQNYSKAKYFAEFRSLFEPLYLQNDESFLSKVNLAFLKAICEALGIQTKITQSSDYELVDGKTERLIGLCKSAGGQHYISGPAAKDYLDESLFEQAGVGLSYMDYSGYPAYTQLYGPFEHGVTILDLLFNEGPNAKAYMKSFEGNR